MTGHIKTLVACVRHAGGSLSEAILLWFALRQLFASIENLFTAWRNGELPPPPPVIPAPLPAAKAPTPPHAPARPCAPAAPKSRARPAPRVIHTRAPTAPRTEPAQAAPGQPAFNPRQTPLPALRAPPAPESKNFDTPRRCRRTPILFRYRINISKPRRRAGPQPLLLLRQRPWPIRHLPWWARQRLRIAPAIHRAQAAGAERRPLRRRFLRVAIRSPLLHPHQRTVDPRHPGMPLRRRGGTRREQKQRKQTQDAHAAIVAQTDEQNLANRAARRGLICPPPACMVRAAAPPLIQGATDPGEAGLVRYF